MLSVTILEFLSSNSDLPRLLFLNSYFDYVPLLKNIHWLLDIVQVLCPSIQGPPQSDLIFSFVFSFFPSGKESNTRSWLFCMCLSFLLLLSHFFLHNGFLVSTWYLQIFSPHKISIIYIAYLPHGQHHVISRREVFELNNLANRIK